jgi:hypothetical protein
MLSDVLVYTNNNVIESYTVANLWTSKANKTIQPSLIIFLLTVATV